MLNNCENVFYHLTSFTPDVYVGLFAYSSSEPGDLTFNQGDVIKVTKRDGDWWTGTIGDRSGIFPANYVKKQDQPQEVSVNTVGNFD